MPVRQAGGPYGRGAFRLTWNGATVFQQIDEATQRAFAETKDAAVEYAKRIAPVRTGALRDSIDGESGVEGTKRFLRLFATVRYAIFPELGTVHMAAQPYLRPAIDAEAPRLTERLRAARLGAA